MLTLYIVIAAVLVFAIIIWANIRQNKREAIAAEIEKLEEESLAAEKLEVEAAAIKKKLEDKKIAEAEELKKIAENAAALKKRLMEREVDIKNATGLAPWRTRKKVKKTKKSK